VGSPIVHKELSLVTLVTKWSGSDASFTLEEFMSGVESAPKIGQWSDPDKGEIAILKLTDSASCSTRDVLNCTQKVLVGKVSRTRLGVDMRMSTRTNIISRNCTPQGREKVNLRKNLQTGVGVYPIRLCVRRATP
jgi:hypothetical protein